MHLHSAIIFPERPHTVPDLRPGIKAPYSLLDSWQKESNTLKCSLEPTHRPKLNASAVADLGGFHRFQLKPPFKSLVDSSVPE